MTEAAERIRDYVFCAALPVEQEGDPRAVYDLSRRWPGVRPWLRVAFVETALTWTAAAKAIVEAAAREWEAQGGPRFDFDGTELNAEIRIELTDRPAFTSAIGIDSRHAAFRGRATMSLGLAFDRPGQPLGEEERFGLVLHEFGHAIGALHEHAHPAAGLVWNEPAVLADLGGEPNCWNVPKIRREVFSPAAPGAATSKAFDPDSIMIYPIPRAWLLAGEPVPPRTLLSATDKDFVAQTYASPL